jgi:D-amino peptidase
MSNPKFMVRCDVEGVSGVVSYRQAEPGTPESVFGLRMFQSDLLACVEGLLAGGAGEIVIYDEHYYGRNIDPEWLPENVSFIAGKPPYRNEWAGGLDGTFTGLVLLGFHSKFGTRGGLLPHSYELDIRDLRLNGVSVGEIGMETAIAGELGVPLVLMTGDSAGCREAEALVPGVATVAVKEALGETGGLCQPLTVTRGWIREAARVVASHSPATQPWRCGSPVTLEVSFNSGPYAEALRGLYAADLNAAGDLVLRGNTAVAVWADYWHRKLKAQEAAKA